MRKAITFFIKYPVSVNVSLLAIVVFGYMGMSNLKSSFFPLNPSKIINIQLNYPGASPAEMEEGVVLKIEDNLKGLVGIDRVTSRSVENAATITVETLQDYDVDVVLQDVKNAVDRVPFYPAGMEPPVVAKLESIQEAITLSLSGENVNLRTLKLLARNIENDFRAIDGISQIDITGFPLEEIEIAVRERDLRAYNITFDEVSRAVARSNILTTGGTVRTDAEDYLIRANNRSYFGDELDFIIVRALAGGQVVRLKDVASVRDIWNENPDRSYFNGNTAVTIRVSSTINEDLIVATEKVNEYVEKYNSEHSGISLDVTNDRSIQLTERTLLLLENGGLGIFFVLILLSLFLRPRLAFWVAVGLPVSFFGMFIFASYFGVTINVLSLFGMIIVIGILVDDGIVIAENIYQHHEQGKNPIQAAIDGTMEVLPPIVAAILTTLVAFSTFFFLEGRVGDFFGEVAVVVFLTLTISLFEALIILPSHLAHSDALKHEVKTYKINKWAEQFENWMRDRLYDPSIRFFMRYKLLGLAIPIALLIITVGAINGGLIRLTFFPNIASDRVEVNLRMPQGTNESITDSIISLVEVATWEVNNTLTESQTNNLTVIKNVIKRIGPGSATAQLRINLLPGEDRNVSAQDIANAIEEATGSLHGIESIEYGSGTNFGGKPVSISLLGFDETELRMAKDELKAEFNKNPLLKNISDNDPDGIKEITITLKNNAYLLGLTLNDVMRQVRSGFFGLQVQRFQRGQDEIKVWVRYAIEDRGSVKNLDDMWIVTPAESRVPLSEIADYSIERGVIAINHLDGEREVRVDADVVDRKQSASDIVADYRNNILPDILDHYPSVHAQFEGQNRTANKAMDSVAKVIPIVLILIYVIIAFTFRSYSQPLLLFLMVPFSVIGVGWGHYIHGFAINILSWLGIIALIGIMVNDGLVLIGKFNIFLKQGMPFEDALISAGRSRFRPILLTTLTTIAGLAPLIFETSRQAHFLIPMAIAIAYGIGIATFLTLFLLPLLLSLSNYIKVGIKWFWTGKKPTREEVERAIKERITEAYEVQ